MKKAILTLLLSAAALTGLAQATNLGDAIITAASATPGATIVVGNGTPKKVAYIAAPAATGTFIDITLNGVRQWVDLNTLANQLPKTPGPAGATGPQGPAGATGPAGPAGTWAIPVGTEGQALIFHNGSWQGQQAGVTIAQNYLPGQTGNATICTGSIFISEGHSVASTINISQWTSGTLQMLVSYTDMGGTTRTQAFPVYQGAPLFGAQNTISVICQAGSKIVCFVTVSADWVGTYEVWANVHQY